MGDHFTLLVDKMLTESTIDAVIERQNRFNSRAEASTHESTNTDFSNSHMIVSKSIKLVECRICHDDDQASNMETPCACCGTLKYAHRTCVQRWCNEKGNTICEICLQPFKPGYTSPPQLYLFGRIPMNFRGNWEISRRDLYNWRFSTTFANNHDFIESDFNDQYIAPSSTSILCCRIVAIFFIILLMLRYTLPIIINATDAFSISMFMVTSDFNLCYI
ncbi:uncharacterized protein [Rutidosis leptorrhynchoides]|uniref:uncharacterized protein n=1 Tax=Rutidosis leptorrhynchoides TaxID=125765 RepID=UPI003A99FB9F